MPNMVIVNTRCWIEQTRSHHIWCVDPLVLSRRIADRLVFVAFSSR